MAKPNTALIYRKVPGFLRDCRQRAGLTQRSLAKRLRKSHTWVVRSETGSRRIDVAEFVEFCLACGIDPKEAIGELVRLRR